MPHLGRHAPDSAAARRALRTPHELEKNLHPIGRLLLEPPFEYHSDTSDVTQETTRRQRWPIRSMADLLPRRMRASESGALPTSNKSRRPLGGPMTDWQSSETATSPS